MALPDKEICLEGANLYLAEKNTVMSAWICSSVTKLDKQQNGTPYNLYSV